ncbi:sirohydrochlorin chelatase [Corynebacterium uterequi]|uniref:Sirohydrochlorin cobaltochelatase n=1 Tax=Corynebacterium uterequi TaxID=1072256 RepID=A0A0G3HF84_9CORY|nr:CbiX/SirB N-terminal domain-containing protein [Corynebacterium uterequi]AKK11969.1 hypothetical protein CUTER_10005 [Corynebacterium uterequi]
MTDLIILSHGSRHPRAHATVQRLADATARLVPCGVHVAHLDFDPERTLSAVAQRSGDAVVVPLLFAGGFHTRFDVPNQIRQAESGGVRLTLAPSLGAGPDVAAVLSRRLRADAAEDSVGVLFSVGSSIASSQAAMVALADAVGRAAGRDVDFLSATNMARSLDDVVAEHGRIHLLPLFVAEGLLLDQALARLPAGSTASAPLGEALAGVVAARYRACDPL